MQEHSLREFEALYRRVRALEHRVTVLSFSGVMTAVAVILLALGH